jgi:hypothetical protein
VGGNVGRGWWCWVVVAVRMAQDGGGDGEWLPQFIIYTLFFFSFV